MSEVISNRNKVCRKLMLMAGRGDLRRCPPPFPHLAAKHACTTIMPQYPLSDLAKREADDGRERGVAVIVSINKQRNDAWNLPEDILDRAELQVISV